MLLARGALDGLCPSKPDLPLLRTLVLIDFTNLVACTSVCLSTFHSCTPTPCWDSEYAALWFVM